MKNEQSYMNLSETFAFLNDFGILPAIPSLKRDDIKRLIRLVNLRDRDETALTSNTKAELNYSTFVDFLI